MILMSCRSTPVAVAGSMTRMTASTLMGASRLEYCDTTLEHREVVALFRSVSRSLSSTGRLMAVSTSTPLSTAFWNDSEMMVGWIPVQPGSTTSTLLLQTPSPSPSPSPSYLSAAAWSRHRAALQQSPQQRWCHHQLQCPGLWTVLPADTIREVQINS